MKKSIVGSIYKPPRDNYSIENIQKFNSEFEPVLELLSHRTQEVILGGDWNINLLKINEKSHFSDFLDITFNNGFGPKITLPTRIGTQSATLIDNIFCKSSSCTIDSTSGIIFTEISDHLPYFVCLDNMGVKNPCALPKYAKCRVNKEEAITAYLDELRNTPIYENLNHNLQTDPTEYYDKLIDTTTTLKNKHLPFRFVKFNRHKHKDRKWITYGIIKSIKTRDKKFLKLRNTSSLCPQYQTLKDNLALFNNILKRQIREAKALYYQSIFKEHKGDI